MIGHSVIHPAYKWLWKSCCQPKHKVFFWLLVTDRLSTRNILKRRNMQLDSFDCAICSSSSEETLIHLFVDCPFAAMCWDMIGVHFSSGVSFPGLISQVKLQINSPFFHGSCYSSLWDHLVC